jgi:nitroreductase
MTSPPSTTPDADPWSITPEGFAGLDDPQARLRFLLGYAILAPSSHNTQPWLFRLRGTGLDLLADRRRALHVVDPRDRALVISCGAALGNLRVAAEALGEALDVTLLPDPAQPDLLAHVEARGPCAPHHHALLHAITARRTTRRAFSAETLPQAMLDITAEAAQGATLHWRTEAAARHAIAELVAEGDRTQMGDPGFRAELAAWVRSRRAASRDGMSGHAFGMPDMLSFVGALAIRSFDMGAGQAARDRALADGSPALGVFTTAGDTPRDWMAVGEALERTLLTMTAAHIAHSYLNQPIEVPALRPRLADLLGTLEHPQILIRAGHGPAPEPSVRRPVAAVLA